MYGTRKSDIKAFQERDSTTLGRGRPRPPPHIVSTHSKSLQNQNGSNTGLESPSYEVDKRRRHFQEFQALYHNSFKTNIPKREENTYLRRHERVSNAIKRQQEEENHARPVVVEYEPSPEEQKLLYSVVDPRRFLREEDDSQSVELVSIKLAHKSSRPTEKGTSTSPDYLRKLPTSKKRHDPRQIIKVSSSESSIELASPLRSNNASKLSRHVSQVLKSRDRKDIDVSYDNFGQRRDRPMRSGMPQFPTSEDRGRRKYTTSITNYNARLSPGAQIPYMIDTMQGPRPRKTYSKDLDVRHIEDLIRSSLPQKGTPKLQSNKPTARLDGKPVSVYTSGFNRYYTINEGTETPIDKIQKIRRKYMKSPLETPNSSEQSREELYTRPSRRSRNRAGRYKREECEQIGGEGSHKATTTETKDSSDQSHEPGKQELKPEDIIDIIKHHGPNICKKSQSRKVIQVNPSKEDKGSVYSPHGTIRNAWVGTEQKKGSKENNTVEKKPRRNARMTLQNYANVEKPTSKRTKRPEPMQQHDVIVPTKIPVIRISSVAPNTSKQSVKPFLRKSSAPPSREFGARPSKSPKSPVDTSKQSIAKLSQPPALKPFELLSKISDSIYKDCSRVDANTPVTDESSVAALDYLRKKLDGSNLDQRVEEKRSRTQCGNPLEGHMRKIANEGLSKIDCKIPKPTYLQLNEVKSKMSKPKTTTPFYSRDSKTTPSIIPTPKVQSKYKDFKKPPTPELETVIHAKKVCKDSIKPPVDIPSKELDIVSNDLLTESMPPELPSKKSLLRVHKTTSQTKKAFEEAECRIRNKINKVNSAMKNRSYAAMSQGSKLKIDRISPERKLSKVSFDASVKDKYIEPRTKRVPDEDTVSIFTGNLDNVSSKSVNVKISDGSLKKHPAKSNNQNNLTTWLKIGKNSLDSNMSPSTTTEKGKENKIQIISNVNSNRKTKMNSEPSFRGDDDEELCSAFKTESNVTLTESEVRTDQIFDDIQDLKRVVCMFNTSKKVLLAAQGKMTRLEKHLTKFLEMQPERSKLKIESN